jgi:hypothetical protein
MPPEHLLVRFEIADDRRRRIEFAGRGVRYEGLVEELSRVLQAGTAAR